MRRACTKWGSKLGSRGMGGGFTLDTGRADLPVLTAEQSESEVYTYRVIDSESLPVGFRVISHNRHAKKMGFKIAIGKRWRRRWHNHVVAFEKKSFFLATRRASPHDLQQAHSRFVCKCGGMVLHNEQNLKNNLPCLGNNSNFKLDKEENLRENSFL